MEAHHRAFKVVEERVRIRITVPRSFLIVTRLNGVHQRLALTGIKHLTILDYMVLSSKTTKTPVVELLYYQSNSYGKA